MWFFNLRFDSLPVTKRNNNRRRYFNLKEETKRIFRSNPYISNTKLTLYLWRERERERERTIACRWINIRHNGGSVTIIENDLRRWTSRRFEVDESGRRSPPLADNFVATTKRLRVKVKRGKRGEGGNRGGYKSRRIVWGGGGGKVDRHEGEDYDAGDEDYRNSIIQVGTNKYKNRPTRVCTLFTIWNNKVEETRRSTNS